MNNQGDTQPLVDEACSANCPNPNQNLSQNRQSNIQSSYDEIIPSNAPRTQEVSEPVYTSQLAALFITVNVTIGAGILAMPAIMSTAGLVPSLIIQIFFLLAIIVTVIMCTELTVKTNVSSYHQVIQARCHRYVYYYTQATLLMLCFGAAVAFIVVIGDQSDRILSLLYPTEFCNHPWYMNRGVIMTITTFMFIKPLCCAKTVDFLKYGSFLGIASLGFIVYMVINEFVIQGKVAPDVKYFPDHLSDMWSILPVLCLSFQCHLSLVPTVATIKKEEKYTTYKTVSLAMILAALIYNGVSIMAMLTLGSKIQDDLTESYKDKSWILFSTIALVAIKSVVTLPTVFLPARLSILDLLKNHWGWFSRLSEPTQRISVSFVGINLALTLAVYVPSIQIVVDLLGCLSVMFIFFLPALSYLHQIDENRLLKQHAAGMSADAPLQYSLKDKMKIILSYIFIAIGVIMMFAVLDKSIAAIGNRRKHPLLC